MPIKLPKKFDQILVDGDILVYSLCSSCEYSARFDDDLDVVFCNRNEVLAVANGILEKYRKMAKGKISLYFTGSENFRKDVYPEYKAHRKKVRKPCGYKALKEMLSAAFKTHDEHRLEADDLIGIAQTEAIAKGQTPLIISIDKDFGTIPGWRYNPDKDGFEHSTPEEADYFWLKQTLTGDRTDGYPGLDGVGPVGADTLLKKNGALWSTVEAAFINSGFSAEYAVIQAQLARILRTGEYDFTTKEVKLWQPEKN